MQPHLESNGELFKPLNRRPAAVTVTVRELLTKVQAGEVRIPKFQRPLRWSGQNVVELLDSIWRGYPVGSLLFWKRPAPAEKIKIGNSHLEAPQVSDAWWVVDGQQRVTALGASLLNLDQSGDPRWRVLFDPEKQEFRSGSPAPDREFIDVPLSELGDLRRLGRWLRNCTLSDDQITLVESAQQRLLDYAIPAYIVDTNDEQALRGVFARLNSTGARMRADEVFQALLGAPSSSSSPTLDLDSLQHSCNLDGFGLPPRAEVLKAVLAMSGLDPTRRLEDLGVRVSPRLVSREDAAEALTRTVEFLRNDCRIPQVSLIPYPVVFFILARWFHIHAVSEKATRVLLSRWLWRAAATGTHQRAEVSKMREQVRAIQPQDDQVSLDRLLSRVHPTPPAEWQLKHFHLKSAHSRIEILSMLNESPRDRWGVIQVEELVSAGRIAREIIPASHWTPLSDEGKELARSAANRVLLGSVHTGLKSEICQWSWSQEQTLLRSHLIDEQALDYLKASQFDRFLKHRAQMVRQTTDAFLRQQAAWNQPDIRPLRYYAESGESIA
jgi:hypothetical protein